MSTLTSLANTCFGLFILLWREDMDAIFKKKNQAIFHKLDNFRNISRNPFEECKSCVGRAEFLSALRRPTEQSILKS
jgi:hypothetical protein